MVKKYARVFVAPEFKQLLKMSAAEKNLSIIDLTAEISRNNKPVTGKKINSLWEKLI